MPKLCLMRLSVEAHLFLADHADAFTAEAAEPAISASSSPNLRSPAIGVNSVISVLTKSVKCGRCGWRATSGLLPWRQIGVEVGQRLRRLVLDARDLVADVAAGCRERAQLVDLGLEFGNGFFEVEIAGASDPASNNIGRNVAAGEVDSFFAKED